MPGRILFIDDDPAGREVALFNLGKAGYSVTPASGGQEGLDAFAAADFDLVITDLKMPGISGMEVLRTVRARAPEVPVLVITAFGNIETAVSAMKDGAYDFIGKPFHRDQLLLSVEKALERRRLAAEVRDLRVRAGGVGREIVSVSEPMRLLLEMAARVARTDATVLIWDVHTGKRVFTLAAHSGIRDIAFSPDGAFIAAGGGDGSVILWDAATGTQKLALAGHSTGIQSVAFSPDGKWIATGSEDNTAKIWDVGTGQEILTLPGSSGGVYGVAFNPADPDAHLVVASNDGITRIFLLRIDELLALAETRVTRSLILAECQKYLHVEQCPSEP